MTIKPVAFVLGSFPTLTETFVIGEISALRQRGFSITLFSLREHQSEIQQPEGRALKGELRYAHRLLSPRLLRDNAAWAVRHPRRYFGTIGLLIAHSWRNPPHLLKTLFLFPKAVEFASRMLEQGVGHVHAHWATYPTTVALAISELTGLSYSFTAHAWDANLIRTLLALKLQRARFVVTCTRETQAEMASVAPEARTKIHLNYHGIDIERFAGVRRASEGAPLLMTACGRLVEHKGFADLVRACGILKRRGRDFRCVIIGEGPQRRQLEALVAKEGLRNEVALVGPLPQSDVIGHYARSDVFVMPCLSRPLKLLDHEADLLKAVEVWFDGTGSVVKDGIPNVIVEAMAMGIPVVTTWIGGIPELVRSGHNGLLVEPGNPVSLAEAVERLILDPELRTSLGSRAAADVRADFDRGKNIDDLARIFARTFGWPSGDGAPLPWTVRAVERRGLVRPAREG